MSWASGQEIGPYRLLRRLGRGGFAEVWLAEMSAATGFRRRLALKLVRPESEGGGKLRAEALLREARLTSWLQAPHVVSVERVSVEDDALVLAMEYCDAGTVADLMRRLRIAGLPMPPSVAVDVGIHVSRALVAAHRAADPDGKPLCIVHRDLKPSNVLLTRAGMAMVCDFGIAKAQDETHATGTGILKGTTAYIAPELWEDVCAFSPASDLFALGTLLAEMTTLQQLHGGGSMAAVYRKIAAGDATEDALRVAPYLPPLVPVLEELLRRDPAERLADASEVEARLESIRRTLEGSGDLALALDLLDRAEGAEVDRPLRSLPRAVDRAWQMLIERATGRVVPLVSGPSGSADLWELAIVKPREDEVGGTGLASLASQPSTDAPSQPSSASQSGQRSRRRRRRPKKTLAPALVGVLLALVIGVGIGSLGMVLLARSQRAVEPEVAEGRTPLASATRTPPLRPPPKESPTPAPGPAPTRHATPIPTPEVTPRPTPVASPAPEPSPTAPPVEPTPAAVRPTAPCLAVASRPAGAWVWVNGALQPDRARSHPSLARRMSPGRFVVSMALVRDGERATAELSLDEGEVKVVRCDLLGSGGSCRIAAGDAGLCGD